MIEGKSVILRAVEEADLANLASWLNDPTISHLVVGWSFPVSLAQQKQWFERSLGNTRTQRFMVDTKQGETIGVTGLWDIDWQSRHALTAVKLGTESVRGKGYGRDAIMTLMAYAFHDVGLNRLWTDILQFNRGSYRAYVEKCGWQVEGLLREQVYRDGQYYDLLRVAILKHEFDALPDAADYRREAEADRVDVAPENWVCRDSAAE
jgi:RimJ/RimL family protein N-acetyltransferase